MNEFENLLKKKINKLFLVVWPPWGEENESDIDISFGFIFTEEPNKLCVISVDKDELWFPYVYYQALPKNIFNWEEYYPRMKKWMNAEDENCILDKEYYDVTKCELFREIINSEILEIELLFVERNLVPFGIKILFEKDYIISIPNSDGNTVETKMFNKNNSIANFKHLGNLFFLKV